MKGISPLIAVIILVTLTISIAIIVTTSFISLVKEQTITTESKARCTQAMLDIIETKCVQNILSDWWNSSWDYRKRLTITGTLPIHSLVNLTINHYTLVESGKSLASGNDIRILYWNASNEEVYRMNLTPFNSTNTIIAFRTKANITGTDNNYYMYFGNLNAENPE